MTPKKLLSANDFAAHHPRLLLRPHRLLAVAAACIEEERSLIDLCRSSAATLDTLGVKLRQTTQICIDLDKKGSKDCG